MAVASEGRILLDQRDEGLARVTLSHPGRLNAITVAMWQELASVFAQLAPAPGLRCVLLSGQGGNFAAGADIREFPVQRATQSQVVHYHQNIIAPALTAIAGCPVPVVAAIRGVCVGGGLEIASRCDLRIASPEARFGVPINRLGFPMAPEEMRGLLALAGPALTLEILLEGRVFTADEAMAKGLLTRVVEAEGFDAHINQLAARLSRGAPLAARINKETLRWLMSGPGPAGPDELAHFFRYAESSDHKEGVRAFLAGQAPSFTGD